MISRSWFRFACCSFLLLLIGASGATSATADTVYHYEGKYLPGCKCRITGEFTTIRPIPKDNTGPIVVKSFRFTDGTTVLDKNNSDLSDTTFNYFLLDSEGIPYRWVLQIVGTSGHPTFYSSNFNPTGACEDFVDYDPLPTFGQNHLDPGVWTVREVKPFHSDRDGDRPFHSDRDGDRHEHRD
jgi:hypothetical protein